MSELLTAAEFEAVVNTGLSTDDGDIIDVVIIREEQALALLIGPLTGERTDTLYPGGRDGPLTLARFTSEVEVEDAGTVLDPESVALVADGNGRLGGAVMRLNGGPWAGVVRLTYEPADEELVKRYLIEAVRGELAPDRERVVAEDRSGASMHRENAYATRRRLLADIRPRSRSWDVRLRSRERVLA